MMHPDAPAAPPGNAPIMTKNVAAQAALGCGAQLTAPGQRGIGELMPWYQTIALWQKIGLVIGGLGLVAGVGYGVYRIVR